MLCNHNLEGKEWNAQASNMRQCEEGGPGAERQMLADFFSFFLFFFFLRKIKGKKGIAKAPL